MLDASAHRSLLLLTLLAACIDTRASERDALDASTLDAGSDSGKSDGGSGNPDASSTKDKPGACKGDTSLCREQTNSCVQCLNHGDCTEGSAARCDDGACVACTDNAECAHIPGMHACVEGACVECTRELKSACERDGVQYVCNANTHACDFARTVGSKELCGECVSNDECKEGDACVEVPASGASGVRVCQRVRVGDNCTRPYLDDVAAPSADGPSVEVCTFRQETTCEAHLHYDDLKVDCGVPNSALPDGGVGVLGDDSRCGVAGVNDGYCVKRGDGSWGCTVPCSNLLDCPELAASCGDPPNIPANRCSL